MDAPETRYARSTRGRIAYQTMGNGPVDLVVAHGLPIPIDLMWDEPVVVRFLDRLSSFCRHIWFDPRGRGSSDPVPRNESNILEGLAEDILAVIDAVGCERVAVLAQVAPPALLFAATHPERTSALVLINTTGARSNHLIASPLASESSLRNDDRADALLGEVGDQLLDEYRRGWGTGSVLDVLAPSVAGDTRFRRWWGRCERLTSSSDEQYERIRRGWDIDVRDVLPSITMPTLVVSRAGTPTVAPRHLADHISGARYMEMPGDDVIFFVGDTEPMLDEIETFLTGARPAVTADRVLATVLFADISASTERASSLGDRAWRELLDRFRATVRDHLRLFRGREVNTRGDDFLATFDGPALAVQCAVALIDASRAIGVEIRTGLHTGEVQLMQDDIGGIAVHIGARISELARPGEVLVSRTVVDLVLGSQLEFSSRGTHALKGVPGTWPLFTLIPSTSI